VIVELLAGPVLEVAPRLLGMRLRSEMGGEPTEVVLTEVEAYGGVDDPASHAYPGPTRRNQTMFGPPGGLYVYRSYGVHWCANIVTGDPEVGQAVLLRSGQPLIGEDVMARRRARPDRLATGPGNLTKALGIDGALDGSSVLEGPVWLLDGEPVPGTIVTTPRIGITRAVELPWRFVLRST
jgi:DNA-3-methyladenine glycosylase